jgi:hypothetical protein
MLQLVHLVLDLLETPEGRERRLMHRRTRFEVNVLVQEAQTKATRAHDVAAIRRLVTTDETKDRALAGAVSPYQSDVFSGIYL